MFPAHSVDRWCMVVRNLACDLACDLCAWIVWMVAGEVLVTTGSAFDGMKSGEVAFLAEQFVETLRRSRRGKCYRLRLGAIYERFKELAL